MDLASVSDCAVASAALSELDCHGQLFRGQQISELDGRQWMALYTKSRQEKALARYLCAKRVPHYLPLYEKQSLSRGRRITSVVPFFSNYVFLFGDRAERVAALESNRVARTIDVPDWRQDEFGNDLAQIQCLIESGVPVSLESRIEPGERVRIKSGRLAGLEGVVTKRRGGWRLLIAVNYLQQGASIEIDDFAVEVV
jgi:transcriptional antiterminator RfaH